MKHLFRVLYALLCAAALSVCAFADVMPGGLMRNSTPGAALLVGVICVALAILYLLRQKHKK
jgi:hypothetical protein